MEDQAILLVRKKLKKPQKSIFKLNPLSEDSQLAIWCSNRAYRTESKRDCSNSSLNTLAEEVFHLLSPSEILQQIQIFWDVGSWKEICYQQQILDSDKILVISYFIIIHWYSLLTNYIFVLCWQITNIFWVHKGFQPKKLPVVFRALQIPAKRRSWIRDKLTYSE